MSWQVVGRRVFRKEDCIHKSAKSLKPFEGLLEPLVVMDAVYGKLLARTERGGAPDEVLECGPAQHITNHCTIARSLAYCHRKSHG